MKMSRTVAIASGTLFGGLIGVSFPFLCVGLLETFGLFAYEGGLQVFLILLILVPLCCVFCIVGGGLAFVTIDKHFSPERLISHSRKRSGCESIFSSD